MEILGSLEPLGCRSTHTFDTSLVCIFLIVCPLIIAVIVTIIVVMLVVIMEAFFVASVVVTAPVAVVVVVAVLVLLVCSGLVLVGCLPVGMWALVHCRGHKALTRARIMTRIMTRL